jgi:hypothetical protein
LAAGNVVLHVTGLSAVRHDEWPCSQAAPRFKRKNGIVQMEDVRNHIAAMAAKCRAVLRGSHEKEPRLPKALHPKHLLSMCSQIETHANTWPISRLHRWLGSIQAAILANRMLDLDGIKAMFDTIKGSVAANEEDANLIDHLDVNNTFLLDIGGQG